MYLAPSSMMGDFEEQKPSSSKVGYYNHDMALAPSWMLDEPGGQKPSSSKVGYHIQGMIPAPSLMMKLGEESPSLELDCYIRDTFLPWLSTMKPGEGSSPW